MIRATYGATAITRVMVGRTSATQLFHGRDPGGTVLMAGRTWDTVVANRMTSTTATTNSGSAARTSSRFELVVSKTFTSLGLSNVLTGSWAASDVPRLPCSRPVTQVQYWVSTGWSRCSWRRRAARLAGVADRPRMARAGSPGSAWVARNTRIDTRIRTRIPSSSRRMMNPDTPRNLNLFTTTLSAGASRTRSCGSRGRSYPG